MAGELKTMASAAEVPPTRVLVVDDEQDVRFLVRATISLTRSDVVVVAEAEDAEHALARWQESRPDVVVLDYLLPGRNGLEVARDILAARPDQPIILFSAYVDAATLVVVRELGVAEVLVKDRVRELPALARTCHLRSIGGAMP